MRYPSMTDVEAMARSTEIPAVLDEEMELFLANIGELDRVRSGEARCLACERPLSLKTIQLVAPAGDRVEYVCDLDSCLLQFATNSSDNPV